MKFFLLIAYTLEVVGAFILAADSIGLERISGWQRIFLKAKNQVIGNEKSDDTIFKPSFPRLLAAFGGMVGSAFGYWFGTHPPNWSASMNEKLFTIFSSIVGAFGGILFAFLVILLVSFIATFLRQIEIRARDKTIGLIGFIFLLAGFLIQFSTTLIEIMEKE